VDCTAKPLTVAVEEWAVRNQVILAVVGCVHHVWLPQQLPMHGCWVYAVVCVLFHMTSSNSRLFHYVPHIVFVLRT
jgi:hypothetical protein